MKNNYFVSVNDALISMLDVVRSGQVTELKTVDAAGYILAKDVKSPYDSPPFHQSAMDGYALKFDDYTPGNALSLAGESAAGKNFEGRAGKGSVIRIFTGANVPPGTDTVVMQEKVTLEKGKVIISDELLKKGSNVRLRGSQIGKGGVGVSKGTYLNAGTVGYIAALGVEKVKVYRKPTVTIIITGQELAAAGKALKPGEVYESNSATLLSALQPEGIYELKVVKIKDNFDSTRKAFIKAMPTSDFIIFTGGISVGDYDFVGKVMEDEKVRTIFYKVKQKPGKPLYFGVKKNKYIFGLPGNPASVLTCFYEFVRPALRKFQNHPAVFTSHLELPLATQLDKKPGLTHFIRAYTDFKTVKSLPGQESYLMKSFTEANCFIVLPEEVTTLNAGTLVSVHLF